MILEVAVLNIVPERTNEFEKQFFVAQEIISSMNGYKWHQLQKCIEVPSRYILLVEWETLKDHTVGFRLSPEFKDWKKLLHHFYDPFPTVEHYERIHKK